MAEGNKENWTTYLSITTVLIALCATLSTFKGGGYSNKSLMSQTKASDQWAFYQSKSIKSYIFGMQKDNMELQRDLIAKSNKDKEILDKYDKQINEYSKKIAQYEVDKQQAAQDAKKFESERDDCKIHSAAFGIAVIFLQISILLSSIAALAKKKFVWYLSLIVGIAGIVYFFNGFFLFM